MKSFRTSLRMVALALTAALALPASNAFAQLPVGAQAPDFSLQGALAGQPLTFSLKQSLAKGPVVLYFFPAAFTAGCTMEAHLFAEATDEFKQLGATVVGVTAGNVDRVAEFSKVECRDKFEVAADPGAEVAKQFDSLIEGADKPISDRTSYVIAPDGKILMAYTDRNPEKHVQMAMEAVRAWHQQHG